MDVYIYIMYTMWSPAQAAPPDIIELMLSSPSAAQAAKDATEGMDVVGVWSF